MNAEIRNARAAPRPIRLKDYRPPDWLIESVELDVDLGETATRVRARLAIARNHKGRRRPLVLNGQALKTIAVAIDGTALPTKAYKTSDETLTIARPPDSFVLETEVEIHPQDNTALEGLYKSGGMFCTQCEAEGFRGITWFIDRPDVMAVYRVTITAEKARYPVLLSNGNRVESADLANGRHRAVWHDPHRKPCYLFALVAGDLACVEDRFTTMSGREVALRIYVEPGNEDRCGWAMRSLKNAMRWDEEVFGLEYDLDVFMIVAVNDFNMGAMENKGLNVFNAKYILAKPETATDAEYEFIESVIAHEYFHNWTGNRVTCRDWFQLSLKEGLTVFRDQQFSAAMRGAAVKRIGDVRMLRARQFPEDAGPLAHPVRPETYIEINNFYTATVYLKGAELLRMIQVLVGAAGFRRGLALYLGRHDGQAATTDDFLAAMEEANGVDLGQFRTWYRQAGTPVVAAEGDYDAASRTYTLRLTQYCPPTPEQSIKESLHLPLAMGLLDGEGREIPLRLEGEKAPGGGSRVLELRRSEEVFRFLDVPCPPTPSLLRGFSAPVKLRVDYSDTELALLLARDADAFNRWEAAQTLAVRAVLAGVAARHRGEDTPPPRILIDALERVLQTPDSDPALVAQLLELPGEIYLGEQMAVVDVEGIHAAREFLRRTLAAALAGSLERIYGELAGSGPYRIDPEAIGRRALRNRCLDYLGTLDDARGDLALAQLEAADNMTDELAALSVIARGGRPYRARALAGFYERWRDEALVVDKWFSLQATAPRPDALEEVRRLMAHPAFTPRNPNKVRALLGAFFQGNPVRFHATDGQGYAFLAEQVLNLDGLNPQVAARLLTPLTRWRRHDTVRQALMRTALERILAAPALSPDVYEVASRSMAAADSVT